MTKQSVNAEKKFLFLLESYINALPRISKHIRPLNKEDASLLKEFCEMMQIQELYHTLISMINSDSFVHTITHGDATFLNIIYDGKDFYYIDFENVGTRIFFFDIFFFLYIYSENFDFSLLENYFAGFYDEKFCSLFNTLALDFKPENRLLYFLVFLFFSINITIF
jgi:thiamine kinase-like enzyme